MMTPQEQLEWLWANCNIVYWPKGNKPPFTLNPIPRIYDGNIIEAEAKARVAHNQLIARLRMAQ